MERTAYLLLLAIVALLPWPWGSVGRGAQSLVWLTTGLGLAASCLAARQDDRPAEKFLFVAVALWLFWLGWIGASLLPLPAEWLAAWSPQAAELQTSLHTLGVGPQGSLSVEPGRTRAEFADTLGLFALYLLAARVIRGGERRRTLLTVLALTAGAQALYGLGMTLTGVEYGFFEQKTSGQGLATGTFVNRNHFAHSLALGGAATLALLLTKPGLSTLASGWRRTVLGIADWLMSAAFVWRVLLLILLAAVVLSQSRTGNVVFVGVLGLGIVLWAGFHARARLLPAILLLLSFALADIFIVNHYYGLDRVVHRLDQTQLSSEQRTIAWQDLAPLFDRYGPTGSGLGSFQSVFMPLQSETLRQRYDHAHNAFAEFLIETGGVGLTWLLVFGALHVLHALRVLWKRRSREARALGLASALAILAAGAHSLTDFVLHIPALRGWLVILMGAAAATRIRSAAPDQSDRMHDVVVRPRSKEPS